MDLQELNQILKTQLAHLLLSIPEQKDLALDADLTKPLDRVAGVSFLKENGVNKIFKLDSNQKALPGCHQRIYLVRPKVSTMKLIADQIKTERSKNEQRSYKIVFVPRKLFVCERILENEGVMGYISLDEFPMELIPLDTDLLSLELPEFFKSFYLDKDATYLHTVASSIVNLQRLFGKIPNVYMLGKGAKMTFELMLSMLEARIDRKESTKYSIGQLFIIDRDVDLISPLCSPMTYEALLDDVFGIECSVINFDASVTTDKDTKLLLTSDDEIYKPIRDRHFAHISSYLSNKAKQLQAMHNKKDNLKSVGDMRQFVGNELKVLRNQQKLLSTHIGACEVIMKDKNKSDFECSLRTEHNLLDGTGTKESITYIEECLQKQSSHFETLRLMCLLSLTQEGLAGRDYKSLKTQFLQSYGFEYLATFLNLKKIGLLTEQETAGTHASKMISGKKSNYRALNKRLSLVPKHEEDLDLSNPKDMSYVFSGAYTPLACRMVEQILVRDTLLSLEEPGRLCGGLFSDIKIKKQAGRANSASNDPVMKIVLVYFLGGCTYSEISALRFVARQLGIRIVVATTAMLNGKTLLNDLIE